MYCLFLMHLVEIQHFVIALLQAAQCSGYRAQLPTIVPGYDSHWGCDCLETKNMGYMEQGENIHGAGFFASKPCITVRFGAAMLA